jgi:cytochrome c553
MVAFVAAAATLCQCASQGHRDLPASDVADAGVGGTVPISVSPIATFSDDASPAASSPGTGSQPTFGPTTTARVAPPPISGGTMLVTADNARVVMSDPDRDLIYVMDLRSRAVTHTVALSAGDEPGRLVEDGTGNVHVALRGGGALVTINPATGSVLARREACPAPRGLAWDRSSDLVWVACATGELVAFPAGRGAAADGLMVERDLRDVVDIGGSLAVTSFRSAQVLRLASGGIVTRRDALPSPASGFAPHVAWRAVAGPAGTVVAVHQAQATRSLSTTTQGGYGCTGGFIVQGAEVQLDSGLDDSSSTETGPSDAGSAEAAPTVDRGPFSGCHLAADAEASTSAPAPGSLPPPPALPLPPGFVGGGLGCGPESGAVLGVLTVLGSDGTPFVNTEFSAALPVDVAVSADGGAIAAVAAGNAFTSGLNTVFLFTSCGDITASTIVPGLGSVQPIAVAFDTSNEVLVQTREPATLAIFDPGLASAVTIPLSPSTREDTGADIFHTQAGAMIACASCHPEGGDDGHVWLLDGSLRRTPSLRGTIAGTAPYHWPGDEKNLTVLVNDVYTGRMSGATLDDSQMSALTGWVQAIPAPHPPSWVDPASASRGEALFHRGDVQCSTCHNGAKLTNNQTMDVGTGGAFQVPPLVGVGWRTPLMHDGCATTLADRFGACATPQHGSTTLLSASDIADLTAYLETL